MGIEKQETHRPGGLKQTNKTHKHGKHRSKGSISVASKGKVDVKALSKKRKSELNKDQRRHQAQQIRRNKRDEVLNKKRSLGSFDHAPFLTCIIPLNRLTTADSTLAPLTECDPEAVIKRSTSGVTHVSSLRFKQRFSFVSPSTDNDLAILDTLKVCDTVLFLMSANAGISFGAEMIDKWGMNILMSAVAQGLPTPIFALTELDALAVKKQNEQKQTAQKLVSKWLPEEKIVNLSKTADGLNVLRKIGGQKRRSVIYRDRRPHLYSETYEYVPEEQGTNGTVKVTGFLRGTVLSVNDLVYISGLGCFQMSQIDAPSDPFVLEKQRNTATVTDDASKTEFMRVLERAEPSKQESLQMENEPDPLDAEQTWPTEEEIKMANEENKVKKVKKVPKGWSEYQAAWIPDDDAVSISGSEDSDDDDKVEAMSEERSESEEEEEFETMTESEIPINDQQYDQQMDLLSEQTDLDKLKKAKMDKMFPDEMDTPQDVTARVRFQKFRGLESFRTSPWDTKENLPSDYARIFQFENFDRTKKRILKEREDKDGALPGWFITVHVKGVDQTLWKAFQSTNPPVILMGVLPHENKMSVVNVILKRVGSHEDPIKSKEKLIFQCGYRRFVTNPVFSQHTNGKKHKFERFFQPDSTVVATFFAPVQFPPARVLCYKEVNGELTLIATGSILSCNPDRIILKRIVLSGHPLKVNKRSAVIRFMFFNREDIIYFKPCKLRTKYGRIGHIKEPLGTHGHMKCVFDGQLKSQDTILLNLYKRVFPKWTYEECITRCDAFVSGQMET